MKMIPLTRGKITIVDDVDYASIAAYNWFARPIRRKKDKYEAVRNRRVGEQYPAAIVKMHRQITHAPRGLDVDHQNGNPLDNRRANLRVCTRSQNAMNTAKRFGRSKYKGVSWSKQQGKWHSRIWKDGKVHHLGFHEEEIEAAIAYDRHARKYHGEFARLNFPASQITSLPTS